MGSGEEELISMGAVGFVRLGLVMVGLLSGLLFSEVIFLTSDFGSWPYYAGKV